MVLTKLNKDQKNLTKALWGILCVFHFILFTLVYYKFIEAKLLQNEELRMYVISIVMILSLTNIFLFKKFYSKSFLINLINNKSIDHTNISPQQLEDFKKLNVHEKKKFYYYSIVSTRLFLNWLINECICAIGFLAIIAGLPTIYFYTFTLIALALMIYMFPKDKVILLTLDNLISK